jgi:hypothetical protein
MACLIRTIRHLAQSAVMLCTLVITAAGFLRLWLRSSAALAAENLFLRQQLALYQARHVKPERASDARMVKKLETAFTAVSTTQSSPHFGLHSGHSIADTQR